MKKDLVALVIIQSTEIFDKMQDGSLSRNFYIASKLLVSKVYGPKLSSSIRFLISKTFSASEFT